MADDLSTPTDSAARWRYGLVVVVVGFATILIAFTVAIVKFDNAQDIGATLGIIVSPIAAIIGTYFGVQAGSAGKEQADDNARKNLAIGAGLGTATTNDEVREILRGHY